MPRHVWGVESYDPFRGPGAQGTQWIIAETQEACERWVRSLYLRSNVTLGEFKIMSGTPSIFLLEAPDSKHWYVKRMVVHQPDCPILDRPVPGMGDAEIARCTCKSDAG